ncbi:GerAB/ArcD/ProY family transporter [Ferviditalea candida]|uniref:Endospore germination permease n=1 Tax=Ferviditalea candida TaxID=3108399 RepID=A0ABU5ZJ81_9BACL|nr:endospore germination permease [Paenibacillaceae bacterium T2]
MEVISYRQTVFLCSLILPVTGHMLLLPTMFALSGRDAWISILLTVPIGILYGFMLYRLHSLHPSLTMVQMLERALGRWVGKLLATSLLAYFFFMMVITLYGLYDFIENIFLPETPAWAISAAFYLVVLYALFVGIESIARISEPLLLIILFTGDTIMIATQPEKNYKVLFPLFEHGYLPVMTGILVTTALFGETILLTMLKMKKDYAKSKSLLFNYTILVFLITFMFVGTIISPLTIFGLEQVKNLEYPAQSVVRMVSFGFIDRFDIYGIGVMVVGSVIRMSTFQYVLNMGIRQWLGIRWRWIIHAVIGVALFAVALYGIQSHQQFTRTYMNTWYPLTAIVSVGLPFIAWMILEIRNRLGSNKTK